MVASSAAGSPGDGATTNERILVERSQAGDGSAFGELYQRHVDRVYSYILVRVRERGVAEDLTQEVFLQALRALPAFEWQGAIAPWFLRIARNAVIDHWRRVGRRPEQALSAFEEDEGEEDLIERLAEGSQAESEAEDRAELVVARERIDRAVIYLTELQQQVLAFRFGAGLSIKETADAMGKSEGAVKNLQHHALRALKKHLDL